jgi:hypothetical protein
MGTPGGFREGELYLDSLQGRGQRPTSCELEHFGCLIVVRIVVKLEVKVRR